MYDPYGMFRQVPRLQKRRGRAQTLRGGGIGGQVGGINRQVNRGGGSQLAGAQPQIQRSMGGNKLMGGSSIKTGPGQPEPQQEGLLGGLLEAKGAYDTTQEAYAGGKNIANKIKNFDYQTDIADPVSEAYNQIKNFDVRDTLSGLTGGPTDPTNYQSVSNLKAVRSPAGGTSTGQLTQSTPQSTNLGLGSSTGTSNLSHGPRTVSNTPLPTDFSSVGGEIRSLGGNQVGAGSSYAGGSEAFTTGSQGAAEGATGLSQTGAETAAQSGGSKALGAIGAGVGVGLSAYDISQNGANFGNVAGLAGSAILAGTTAFGLANAWNPVGWALLAGSAAYSIFG